MSDIFLLVDQSFTKLKSGQIISFAGTCIHFILGCLVCCKEKIDYIFEIFLKKKKINKKPNNSIEQDRRKRIKWKLVPARLIYLSTFHSIKLWFRSKNYSYTLHQSMWPSIEIKSKGNYPKQLVGIMWKAITGSAKLPVWCQEKTQEPAIK